MSDNENPEIEPQTPEAEAPADPLGVLPPV